MTKAIPGAPYFVSVRGQYQSMVGDKSAPVGPIYGVAGTGFSVSTPQVVEPKTKFLVIVAGLLPKSKVAVGVPGTKGSCVITLFAQCTFSASVASPGQSVALATSGGATATAPFYVVSVSCSAQVHHGTNATCQFAHLPPNTAVVLRSSDGRSFSTMSAANGTASIPVSTTKAGFLSLTPTVGDWTLKVRQVLVS